MKKKFIFCYLCLLPNSSLSFHSNLYTFTMTTTTARSIKSWSFTEIWFGIFSCLIATTQYCSLLNSWYYLTFVAVFVICVHSNDDDDCCNMLHFVLFICCYVYCSDGYQFLAFFFFLWFLLLSTTCCIYILFTVIYTHPFVEKCCSCGVLFSF